MANYVLYTYHNDPYKTVSGSPCMIPRLVDGQDPGKHTTVLHYRPDKVDQMYDIQSYADLQRFSDNAKADIGNEHAFFHVKEEVPDLLVPISQPYRDNNAPLGQPTGRIAYDFGPDYPYSGYEWASLGANLFKEVQIADYYEGWWGVTYYYCYVSVTQYKLEPYGKGFKLMYRTYGDSWSASQYGKHPPKGHTFVEQLTSEAMVGILNANWETSCYYDDWFWGRYMRQAIYTTPSGFDPEMDYKDLLKYHGIPAGLEADCCANAMAATSLNSNTIANGLELFDLAASIKNGRIFSDIIRKGHIFETSKNAWLAYRYSYNTTLADVEELGRFIEQGNQTICRGGEETDFGEMHVKIILSPKQSQVRKVFDRLTSVGVAPNLYNLWDMVPYSFVIDWFADIGGVLESITKYGRCAAYDIQSVTTSWKWTDTVQKNGVKAKLTFYQRHVSRHVPPYVPYVESGPVGDSTKLKRLIDSVALFT